MPMRTYDVPGQTVRVAAGERFAVALEGNPSTGYTWQLSADEQYLTLLAQDFEPHGQGVGASGREIFRFRARSPGRATITCEYRRPWDQKARDTASFEVQIE
jgi:inhibitor of cysteine peptidase